MSLSRAAGCLVVVAGEGALAALSITQSRSKVTPDNR